MAKSKKKNVVSPTLSKKKKNSNKLMKNIKKKKNYFWLIASLVLFILSLITFGLYLWCPFPSIFVVDDIYVSDAKQKTKIIVDEKGTEASAITMITMNKTTAVMTETEIIDVTVNKPFMYVIRDSSTNIILFAGYVYNF